MASATHTAPSASRHIPSGANTAAPRAAARSSVVGGGPSAAQSRRGPSVPSAAMSKALIRLPNDSLTISVEPSGVIADPFGKNNGSLATLTAPSGSTFASTALCIAAPAIRSNPKLPTYAVPSGPTTMSLTCPVATPPRSACSTSSPDGSCRSRRRSRIETITVRPSGSQPSPEGWPATVTISSGSSPGTTAMTRWV